MENEITIEKITEKKVIKPAPYTEEMLGMIERFRGMSKEEMIAKFNSPDCSPSWTAYQRRVAKAAMLLHLKGLAQAPAPKVNETTELDDEINAAFVQSKPKSEIEVELEKGLVKTVANPLKVSSVEKVDGRRKPKPLRDLIPEDKKK